MRIALKAHPKDLAHDIRRLDKIKSINDALMKLGWMNHFDPDVAATLIEFHSDHVSWMLHRLRAIAERGEQ